MVRARILQFVSDTTRHVVMPLRRSLDLDYAEDSQAETDMNVVMNEAGHFVEVQGTAEGHAFSRVEFDAMLELAAKGIRDIIAAQDEILARTIHVLPR